MERERELFLSSFGCLSNDFSFIKEYLLHTVVVALESNALRSFERKKERKKESAEKKKKKKKHANDFGGGGVGGVSKLFSIWISRLC